MTEEDRQRTMDFILEQQAQFSVNLESLRESQARTDATVAQLSAQVQGIAGQVQGIAGQIQNMARQQEHIND
jgi:uncharacterized protein (DUF3084 family)